MSVLALKEIRADIRGMEAELLDALVVAVANIDGGGVGHDAKRVGDEEARVLEAKGVDGACDGIEAIGVDEGGALVSSISGSNSSMTAEPSMFSLGTVTRW